LIQSNQTSIVLLNHIWEEAIYFFALSKLVFGWVFDKHYSEQTWIETGVGAIGRVNASWPESLGCLGVEGKKGRDSKKLTSAETMYHRRSGE
jgi:hypothetical protein